MITFLGLIVTILVIIAVARIVRILELTAKLSPEPTEEISQKDNNSQGNLSLFFLFAFMFFIFYTTWRYAKFILPVSASKHGVEIDKLMNVNYVLIFVVFFVTQIALFYCAWKYKHNNNRRGEFIPENHKLELIWTIIPTIVLGGMIVYGLTVWNNITQSDHSRETNVQLIELYGQQFKWTARYPGKDNKLGSAYFMNITPTNPLGIDSLDKKGVGCDDVLTTELHLKVNQPTNFYIRAQDVIHSLFLPHFRLQMNAVPGMTTQFYFVPTITTAQMREKLKNDKFDYILLCNKICGAAHYTMRMKVVVDDDVQFTEWMGKQKPMVETNVASAAPAPENVIALK